MPRQTERLNTEELLMLQEMLVNPVLMSGLRKIFGDREWDRLDGMRSEALGQMRTGEIVRCAAEARMFNEWESTVKKGMERLAPQIR